MPFQLLFPLCSLFFLFVTLGCFNKSLLRLLVDPATPSFELFCTRHVRFYSDNVDLMII